MMSIHARGNSIYDEKKNEKLSERGGERFSIRLGILMNPICRMLVEMLRGPFNRQARRRRDTHESASIRKAEMKFSINLRSRDAGDVSEEAINILIYATGPSSSPKRSASVNKKTLLMFIGHVCEEATTTKVQGELEGQQKGCRNFLPSFRCQKHSNLTKMENQWEGEERTGGGELKILP